VGWARRSLGLGVFVRRTCFEVGYMGVGGDVSVRKVCEEGMKVSLLIVFCNTDAEVG